MRELRGGRRKKDFFFVVPSLALTFHFLFSFSLSLRWREGRLRARFRGAVLCTTMRPVQRRRTAYNIDYAALNEGVGDDDDDDFDDFDVGDGAGADDGTGGEESLFKQQDPVLLRNATLETECAPAMVRSDE